jgi:hypothetical protein
MKITPHLLLTAGALGLVVAGVSVAHPSWPSDLGLDFWNVPSLKERINHDIHLAAHLEAHDVRILQRIAAKEEIVDDLIGGRISLLDAAAQFRALNAGRRDYLAVIRTTYPGRTDDERMCRNVISFVESAVTSDEDGRYVVYRLNEELNRLLANGDVELPGPPVPEQDPPAIDVPDDE